MSVFLFYAIYFYIFTALALEIIQNTFLFVYSASSVTILQ